MLSSPTLDRLTRQIVSSWGWCPGSSLENRAIQQLKRLGLKPTDVTQQHRVAPYRLDFAWPTIKVALEVDGWHHRNPDIAAKDAKRDAFLRARGWLVFRVDDTSGEESLINQLARVCRCANLELRTR